MLATPQTQLRWRSRRALSLRDRLWRLRDITCKPFVLEAIQVTKGATEKETHAQICDAACCAALNGVDVPRAVRGREADSSRPRCRFASPSREGVSQRPAHARIVRASCPRRRAARPCAHRGAEAKERHEHNSCIWMQSSHLFCRAAQLFHLINTCRATTCSVLALPMKEIQNNLSIGPLDKYGSCRAGAQTWPEREAWHLKLIQENLICLRQRF